MSSSIPWKSCAVAVVLLLAGLPGCTPMQAGDNACKGDSAKAWQACGDADREKSDNRSAIAAYGEALRLDPRLFTAYSGRALAYFHMGDLQAAIDELNACIRVEATYANACYYLAFYLIKAGRLEEALVA
jgi:tetratricopeptide (TPR) repeat protein